MYQHKKESLDNWNFYCILVKIIEKNYLTLSTLKEI